MSGAASLETLSGGTVFAAVYMWLPGASSPTRVLIPAAGASAHVYAAGSMTEVDVFATAALTGPPLAQPLTADADGRLPGFVAQPEALDIALSGAGLTPRTVRVGIDAAVLALTDVHVVGSDAAMLAIPGAHEGSVAVRTDLENKVFMNNGGTTGTDADWTQVGFGNVLSVNGASGDVTLHLQDLAATADVALSGHKLTGVGDAGAGTEGLNRQTGDARFVGRDGTGAAGAGLITDARASGPTAVDSTGRSNGQALVFDTASGLWKPAAVVNSFQTRTGAVTLSKADVTGTGLAASDVAAVPTSVVTTKGDILAANATPAVSRLAVGTNGQMLLADSTQTLGLKWSNTLPTTLAIGNGATAMTLNSTAGLTVAGSVQIGNLITDRSLTRSLNVEYGRTIVPGDFEDVHASLFLGSYQGFTTVVQNGTLTNTSAVVTGLSDTSVLRAPNIVTGTNIPAGTRISSIDSGTQITLTQPAIGSGVSSLTFVSNHTQAFGGEAQAQSNNVAMAASMAAVGLTMGSLIGWNGLAVHMSDTNIASPAIVAGLAGTAQVGNTGTPAITGSIDVAAGVVASGVTQFISGFTIASAVGFYARSQTGAGITNAIGVYSESPIRTATGQSLGVGIGLSNTLGARVVVYDGGLHFGSGTAANQGIGIVTGLVKLVFGNDGNGAPRLFTSSGTLFIQYGASGQTIEDGSGNVAMKFAAGAQIGFFGTTPISRPARVGQLTDSSGGTSGGATIAAIGTGATAANQTDTANAVATLAAKVNSLETLWHNYGLTA